MTIVVAGATGLAGSSIVRAFEKAGKEVIGINRSVVDLLDLSATKKFLGGIKPTLVIDAAARVGGIGANNSYPVEFLTDTLHKELDTNVKNNILFGTLQAVDSEKSTLTITDAQGTEWRLKLDDNVNFFKNGGVVDSTALQTNLAIRIRFHAESSGLKVAEAIYFFSPS